MNAWQITLGRYGEQAATTRSPNLCRVFGHHFETCPMQLVLCDPMDAAVSGHCRGVDLGYC
jgi:hypothetical protein